MEDLDESADKSDLSDLPTEEIKKPHVGAKAKHSQRGKMKIANATTSAAARCVGLQKSDSLNHQAKIQDVSLPTQTAKLSRKHARCNENAPAVPALSPYRTRTTGTTNSVGGHHGSSEEQLRHVPSPRREKGAIDASAEENICSLGSDLPQSCRIEQQDRGVSPNLPVNTSTQNLPADAARSKPFPVEQRLTFAPSEATRTLSKGDVLASAGAAVPSPLELQTNVMALPSVLAAGSIPANLESLMASKLRSHQMIGGGDVGDFVMTTYVYPNLCFGDFAPKVSGSEYCHTLLVDSAGDSLSRRLHENVSCHNVQRVQAAYCADSNVIITPFIAVLRSDRFTLLMSPFRMAEPE
jgi:hypothetical protein